LLVTEQETVYATRVPEVMETKLLEENSIREVTASATYTSGGSSSGSNRGTDNNDSDGWQDRDRDGIPDKRDPDDNDPNVRNVSDLKARNRDQAKTAKATKKSHPFSSGNSGAGNSCFLAGTLVQMANGTQKPIEQIDIGDSVSVGGFVFATGKFLINNLFEYKGIKVSGSHMVQEDGRWMRVEDSKLAKSLGTDEHIVYVFGSENRRILIDDVLFTDYFELTEQDKLIEKGDNYFEKWQEEVSKIAKIEAERNVKIMNQQYGE